MLFILTLFTFLFILLLKIVDFEKKYVVCNAIADFVGFQNLQKLITVKLVLSGHSKIDKTKILMTNGSFFLPFITLFSKQMVA